RPGCPRGAKAAPWDTRGSPQGCDIAPREKLRAGVTGQRRERTRETKAIERFLSPSRHRSWHFSECVLCAYLSVSASLRGIDSSPPNERLTNGQPGLPEKCGVPPC